MAGYDLDRYKDLEGVTGIRRVLERPQVVLLPIHHEAPPEDVPKTAKADIHFSFAVISAAPPPEVKKKTARGNVERQMVVMGRVEPKPKKPLTMADIKL